MFNIEHDTTPANIWVRCGQGACSGPDVALAPTSAGNLVIDDSSCHFVVCVGIDIHVEGLAHKHTYTHHQQHK